MGYPRPREIEVLQLIADGYWYVEIAKILDIAMQTVKNHTYNMRERMGVKTTAGAVAIGLRRGLIK